MNDTEIEKKVIKAKIEAIELLFWKYKEDNGQSVDKVFASAYGVIEEELRGQLEELSKV